MTRDKENGLLENKCSAICSHCQCTIMDVDKELPRYHPDIPRCICDKCHKGLMEVCKIIQDSLLRDNAESC